eukprot:5861121-Pleurochrysis_carterae.AAC.2
MGTFPALPSCWDYCPLGCVALAWFHSKTLLSRSLSARVLLRALRTRSTTSRRFARSLHSPRVIGAVVCRRGRSLIRWGRLGGGARRSAPSSWHPRSSHGACSRRGRRSAPPRSRCALLSLSAQAAPSCQDSHPRANCLPSPPRRAAQGKWSWGGVPGLLFGAGGELTTPWGAGAWGLVTAAAATEEEQDEDGINRCTDCIFADFACAAP